MEHAQKLMTVDEFLEWEEDADLRHELVHGILVAMAPAMPAHADLVARAIIVLNHRLRPPCRPLGDAGVITAGDSVRRPDVSVVCGYDRNRHTVEPRLVIEILSPSTRKEDLSVKLGEYKGLPFVDEVWLIDSERRWVQVWVRVNGVWTGQDHVGVGRFFSPTVEGEIGLDELYAGVFQA
jgi:Uma2 family endonuclease